MRCLFSQWPTINVFFDLVGNVWISVITVFHTLPILFHDVIITKTVLELFSHLKHLLLIQYMQNHLSFYVDLYSVTLLNLVNFFLMGSNIFYTYDHLWKLMTFSDSEKDSSCPLSDYVLQTYTKKSPKWTSLARSRSYRKPSLLTIVHDVCCVSPSGLCYGEVISFISTSIECSYQESILDFVKWFFLHQ